nr:hypothetical protein CFP56_01020 [Quercus suber]
MEPNTATCVGEGDVMTPGDSSRSRKFDPTSTSTSLVDTETVKVLPKKQGQRSWQGVRGIAEDRYTSPQAASIDKDSHLSMEAEVSIHRVCSQGVRGSANPRSPRHNKEHTRPRSLASSSHCSSSIQRSKRTPPPAMSRRVSKARANEAKSPGATQPEKHKVLSGQGQSKHATKTRSGRISKKPLRWTPNA